MAEARQEIAREVEGIASLAWAGKQREGRLGLEAAERAVRGSLRQAGSFVLERPINADGAGRQAAFVGCRWKRIDTLPGPAQVRRACPRCTQCGCGAAPKDRGLDIEGISCSPGLRRLMGRAGAKEPFEDGRADLDELVGSDFKMYQMHQFGNVPEPEWQDSL